MGLLVFSDFARLPKSMSSYAYGPCLGAGAEVFLEVDTVNCAVRENSTSVGKSEEIASS